MPQVGEIARRVVLHEKDHGARGQTRLVPVEQRQIAARCRRCAEGVKVVWHVGRLVGRMGDFTPGSREHSAVLRDIAQFSVFRHAFQTGQCAQHIERVKGACYLFIAQRAGGVGRRDGRHFGKERVAFRIGERGKERAQLIAVEVKRAGGQGAQQQHHDERGAAKERTGALHRGKTPLFRR